MMTNNTMNTQNVNATVAQAQEKKAKKKTKRTLFEEILEVVSSQEHKDFIQKEIDALDRKKANAKKTDKQIANEVYGSLMMEKFKTATEPMTISDLKNQIEEIADFSSQKVSGILKKFIQSEELFKFREKGVTYFTTERPTETEEDDAE